MITVLLERRNFFRATHLPRQTCSFAMAVGSKLRASLLDNLLPLTALLLKGQTDCEIPATKIWPLAQGAERDCIRPNSGERPT